MRHNKMRIVMPLGDRITQCVCLAVCLMFLLAFCVPVAFVISSSLFFRGRWSLDGYALLLGNPMVLSGLRNSVTLALVGTLYSLMLEVPAAYVMAKKRYGGLTSAVMTLGQFGISILPLYLLLKQLRLLNTMWALILPCAFSVYYTMLLRARIINIGRELEDAAAIDGAGPLIYLLRVMIPLLGPTVGCIAFFHICSYWSGTFLAQTFITDETRYPLSLVMMELLIRNRSTDVLVGGTTVASVAAVQRAEYALCVLSTLPLVAIFLMIRRRIRTLDPSGSVVL